MTKHFKKRDKVIGKKKSNKDMIGTITDVIHIGKSWKYKVL
jgi:hypothetical protein